MNLRLSLLSEHLAQQVKWSRQNPGATVVGELFLCALCTRRILTAKQVVIHWTRNAMTKDKFSRVHAFSGSKRSTNGKHEHEFLGFE